MFGEAVSGVIAGKLKGFHGRGFRFSFRYKTNQARNT
jgi:hypothetical protein